MKYIQIDMDSKSLPHTKHEVRSAMTMTRQVARQCGISDREMERFF